MAGMRLIGVNECGYRIGESHPRCTLSDTVVEAIRDLREFRNLSYGQISLRLKISLSTVKKICRYERRIQVADRWKMEN